MTEGLLPKANTDEAVGSLLPAIPPNVLAAAACPKIGVELPKAVCGAATGAAENPPKVDLFSAGFGADVEPKLNVFVG